MKYTIRKEKKGDCMGVSHVITIAWNETYKGIMSDCFLEELKTNELKRGEDAKEKFATKDYSTLVLEINNQVVGFANYGKTEDLEFDNCGEIFALYIIKKYHHYGFGKKLVEESIKNLKEMGFDKMLVSCLKENPSNEFYKHIGGKYIKNKIYKQLNLPENVYYFDI